MDHGYIDEHSLAERYVDNALTPEERAVFEAHLVDCEECTDRLLLAGMFHVRLPRPTFNGKPRPGLVVRFRTRQVLAIFVIAALLLLAIPILLIPLWETLRR
jgi:hypothetical protein